MSHPSRYCVPVLALLSLAAPAHGALIYVNSSQATIGASSGSAGSFRYLLSNTNYDQNIHNGVGSISGTNILTSNLGTISTLNNRTFTFTLQHLPAEGFVFTLAAPATPNLAAINSRLAWGTFATPVPGAVSTIDGVAPTADFNTISITASGQRASASFAFADLAFSSPTLSLADGAFYSGVASRNASNADTGYLTAPAPSVSPFSFLTQRLAADDNLADHAFTLTGSLTALRDISPSGDASVAFTVNLTNNALTLPTPSSPPSTGIPEPTSALALAAPALLTLRRRR